MKRRRVKITGIGPVTPAGIGREAFWKGIQEPVSRVRPYAKFGDEFGPFVAAHMPGFDVGKYVDDRSRVPKGSARHTQFAVAGAVLAMQDAKLSSEEASKANMAIVSGSSLMDFGGISSSSEAVHKRGARGAIARTIFTTGLTSVPDAINQVLGLTARTMTLQSSCCSGVDAIGYAAEMIADGRADIVICGGTEAPLHRCPLLELRAAGLTPMTTDMPERLARPFDLWRTTGVVSEGACMFVLERDESPRRGYSYISGYGFANDAPGNLCGGMTTAARLALADAKLRPEQVEAISAWGPGHKLIDAAEAQSMVELFKSALAEIPVSSIKGAIGSPLGAAGAIQVGASALAQRNATITPTVNYDYADPACPLNLSNVSRAVAHAVTIINSHGVGNVNSSLVLERC
jgi:3-oxoacyl-[acyl-carrier-protein] synthase II